MASASLRSDKANGTKAAMESDMDAVREDVAALRKDISSLAEHFGGFTKAKSAESLEKGKDVASQAGESLADAKGYVEGQVRSNPMAAVGIAFGVGALFAMMRR